MQGPKSNLHGCLEMCYYAFFFFLMECQRFVALYTEQQIYKRENLL